MKKKLKAPYKEMIIQFVKFGIVGFSNAIVSYIINIVILWGLHSKNWTYDYVIANTGAFLLSVLWSFYWNDRYVFDAKNDKGSSVWQRLIKMFICYSFTGIFLNNSLSFFWISVLGISKLVSPLMNLFISVPVNYVMNKKWTFS